MTTTPARSCPDLNLIESRFSSLTSDPDPLTINGAKLGCGLPAHRIPLDQVRVLLLRRQTSWLTKNVVWQELVRLAHSEPEPWCTAAAGMMIPGLKHIGGKLGSRFPGEPADLDAEILEGFLQSLDVAEPTDAKLYGQLYWAAFRRGHELCNKETRLVKQRSRGAEVEAVPECQTGHPDIVLAEAMRNGVVTSQQADLLSDVHLDHAGRSRIARRRGWGRHRLERELSQAQRRLTGYLGAA